MTEDKILKSIENAIDDMTPDILSELEQELGLDQKQVGLVQTAPVRPAGKRSRYYKRLAGLAAVLVLFIGGFALYDREPEVCAVVDLDVNPSVELNVDDNDRVISATALNQDGEDILADLDFSGSDISVAGNAVVGVMLTKGYLSDTSNSILVSVRGNDEAKSRAIEEKLSADLNGYLQSASISAAVQGQYIEDDEELASFAGTNAISEGKAWLIRKLISRDDRLTEDSLLKLSTQELILLGQEKEVFEDVSYGRADKSKYISQKKALRIAVKKAGLPIAKGTPVGEQLDHYSVEFDCDDGMIIYEVDFRSGGAEYEYDIDAVTGDIISHESEGSESDYDDDDRNDADDDDRYEADDRDDRYDADDADDRYESDDDDDRYDSDDDDDDRHDRDDDDDDRHERGDDRDDDDDDDD